MQQQQPMMNMMPPFPPTSITTEQIQKYLDENKKLILAILDNQNLGKLPECAQYQAQLQKNLMYLAAIADAQPPQVPPQMPPHHPVMQQAGHYMQHPQAALALQAGGFPPKVAMQYNPQQLQDQQHQQLQAAMQGHMGMRPGVNNGMHPMHTEANFGGTSNVGPPSTASLADFSRGGASASTSAGAGTSSSSLEARGGSKPDGAEAGSSDAQGNSAAGHSSANGNRHT